MVALLLQVAPVVLLVQGQAATIVRDPSPDTVDVTVELRGPLPALAPVAALVSPRAFVLAPGDVQTVRVRLHEAVAPGTVLRLRTCMTPRAAQTVGTLAGAVARVTLRTCVLAKGIVQ